MRGITTKYDLSRVIEDIIIHIDYHDGFTDLITASGQIIKGDVARNLYFYVSTSYTRFSVSMVLISIVGVLMGLTSRRKVREWIYSIKTSIGDYFND